jgi:hypothetical protein
MSFGVYICIFTLRFMFIAANIIYIAALDHKTRDVPTASSINSLLSQYCKASQFFVVSNFNVLGGGQLFALPRLSHGQRPALALLILYLGARRGWVVNTTPRPLYPRERQDTHCTGGWVGPRADLDVCEKSHPPPGFDPRTVQPEASRYTD